MKDGKMSKSKGNVIYPEQLIENYGLDATKYYLLKAVPTSQDGLFSPEEFIERYNSDLCNDLSNLLNRTVSMVNKYFGGEISNYIGILNEEDKNIEEVSKEVIIKVENAINDFEFSNSIQEIWNYVSRTNKYIDETSPWILAKNEEDIEKLKSCMYHLVANLREIAILIRPFMEETSDNILRQLGINEEICWKSLENYKELANIKSHRKR